MKVDAKISKAILKKTVDEAIEILQRMGLTIRIVQEDGKDLVGIMDFRKTRVNVHTKNGVVIKVVGLG